MGLLRRLSWSIRELFFESGEDKRRKIYNRSKTDLLKKLTLDELKDIETEYGIGEPFVYEMITDKDGNFKQVRRKPTREEQIEHVRTKLTLENIENYFTSHKKNFNQRVSLTEMATYKGYIGQFEISLKKILRNLDRMSNTSDQKDKIYLSKVISKAIHEIKDNEKYFIDLNKIKNVDIILNFGLNDLAEKVSDLIGFEGAITENLTRINSLVKEAIIAMSFVNKALDRISLDQNSNSNLFVPDNKEIEYITRKRYENDIYEFKGLSADMRNICREIAAFSHCKFGGIIFYGIEDDGKISSGVTGDKNDFDNRLRNAIKGLISPNPKIEIIERNPYTKKVFAIVIYPWDKRTVYTFSGSEILIRRGGNVFKASSEEIENLRLGRFVC